MFIFTALSASINNLCTVCVLHYETWIISFAMQRPEGLRITHHIKFDTGNTNNVYKNKNNLIFKMIIT